VLGATDYGYGVDYCKQFAREDPEKAVKNAE
jgi:peptidyl-Lys metalloendopeptidase